MFGNSNSLNGPRQVKVKGQGRATGHPYGNQLASLSFKSDNRSGLRSG